ncbi:MAG: protein kinase domain-containing protein [Phycisphaerales bacterium]
MIDRHDANHGGGRGSGDGAAGDWEREATLLDRCDRASCPGLAALEGVADGSADAAGVLLPGCERCERRLAGVRSNRALLDELRSVSCEGVGSGSESASPPSPPSLAGYSVGGLISAGGQATVFRGVHEASGRPVAIKVMHGIDAEHPGDATDVARLDRELRILARFRHPGIVTVYDGGRTGDGLPYIVMELVEGGTLKDHASVRRFGETKGGIREAGTLIRDVARAVAAAQRTGLIHRDLKPGNILIDDAGRPKVVDFGIAGERGEPGVSGTDDGEEGRFVGSVAYAAPEQFDPNGIGALDARVDVFSLGLILRELLTGRRLRRNPLRSEAAAGAREENRLVPVDLDRIVSRATAIDPDHRYPSASALGEDLDRWLRGYPIEERRSEAWHVVMLFVGRHPIASAAGVVFLLLLVSYAATITTAAAMIRSKNVDLRHRLVQRESVMSAISEPLAALDADSSLESVRDIDELLVRAAEAIGRHLGDEPALQSRLLSRVGLALLYRRAFDEAELCLERAYEGEREVAAAVDGVGRGATPRLAETLHDLGRLYWHRANVERFGSERVRAEEYQARSIDCYERSYRMRQELLERDDPELVRTMSHLGSAYSAIGRFEDADRMFDRVLAVLEGSDDDGSLELVRILMSLGSHRYRKNDLPGSEAAYAHAERVARETSVGLPLAAAINARGLLLLELDRPREARERFDEAGQLRRDLLGPFDPEFLASRRDMAMAMLEANLPSEAHGVANAVLQSIELAGPRARGLERTARFIVAAAEARMGRGRGGGVPEALASLWEELSAVPRAPERTDRRTERLRASVGLELLGVLVDSGDGSLDSASIAEEVRLDLESLVPSPRRTRDLARLVDLAGRAGASAGARDSATGEDVARGRMP